jgi:hypothetical protein
MKGVEMDMACSTHGSKAKLVLEFLVGNPERKRSLRRRMRRLYDNIKMYHKEMVLEVVDWILLAQEWDQWRALVNTVMGFQRILAIL